MFHLSLVLHGNHVYCTTAPSDRDPSTLHHTSDQYIRRHLLSYAAAHEVVALSYKGLAGSCSSKLMLDSCRAILGC